MAEQYVIGVEGRVIGGPFDKKAEINAFCKGYNAGRRTTENKTLTLYVLELPPEMYRVVDGMVVATGRIDAEKIS